MPDERSQRIANMLAAAIGGPDDALDLHLIAASADRSRMRRALAKARQTFTGCRLGRGAIEVTYSPWHVERNTRYDLSCNGAPAELTFSLDDSDQITGFAAHAPHAADALCWQ